MPSANTVDEGVKVNFGQWCNQQVATCPLICHDEFGQGAIKNICDTASLASDCICAGGLRPNLNEYTQTIHYFTCTYDQQSCVHSCAPGDNKCTTSCESTYLCGAAHPRQGNATEVYPPLTNPSNQGSNGQDSSSSRNGVSEHLKPVPNGGMTFLSASNSLYNFQLAGSGAWMTATVLLALLQ